ncbi:hypothetical protein V495_03136 [Pseudogymnoascus sp. VKM F-4514 (FW-929)]|nr:hypothetical protein V495_03136 [Pseudogymnoascus sp. VKM F-4514 (FW-929)]KFY60808.1 hypothetical protein V497_03356 [Pseudogymnoascus sp. VKM F-4516 (FW-969)]
MARPIPEIKITEVTSDGSIDVDNDADDEYFDSQEDNLSLSPQTTRTTITRQITIEEQVTPGQGAGQATGQVTGQVTEEVYASKPTGDNRGRQPTSQKVKFKQATGTITGQLPPSKDAKDAKQVRISGKVTELIETEEPAGPDENETEKPAEQRPGPSTGTSTPLSSRSIRKAISAVLDGSPFKSSPSNNEIPLPPNPRSQTAADPPRPAMDGYEWVWFPAGYWAEREIFTRPAKLIRPPKWVRRSLQGSVGSSFGTPLPSAPRSLNASEVWLKHPKDLEDEAEEDNGPDGPQRRRASTPPGRIMSPDGEIPAPPKNIFQKLQRISSIRKISGPLSRKGKEREELNLTPPPIDLERQTTNTLRGTSRFFSQYIADKRRQAQADQPNRPITLDGRSLRIPRKRFGLAPWHQNGSGDTIRSTTSSIKDLLFGKTPVSTPRSDAPVDDAKPDQYFGVEVPGSRALGEGRNPFQSFQDNSASGSAEQSPIETPLSGPSGPSSLSQANSGSSMVPLTSKTAAVGYTGEPVYQGVPSQSDRGNYATELTEHLAGSPLCPLHDRVTIKKEGHKDEQNNDVDGDHNWGNWERVDYRHGYYHFLSGRLCCGIAYAKAYKERATRKSSITYSAPNRVSAIQSGKLIP